MNAPYRCRICQSQNAGRSLQIQEMMYGSKEEFEYIQCGDCGSLQISEIPDDLARYYPSDYYSMTGDAAGAPSLQARLKIGLAQGRDNLYCQLPGSLRSALHLPGPTRGDLTALVAAGARKNDSILDVGCGGAAYFLRYLADIGFENLTGADPFIAKDVIQHGKVKVVRKGLGDLQGQFDFVTLNHSMEHVPSPLAALADISRLLKVGGCCILRVPTPSSQSFDTYGVNWVQLDAPRHLTIPSRAGMPHLAEAAGFELVDTLDDSTWFQFVGSELFSRDIALQSEEARTAFSQAEKDAFEARAKELNKARRGDQVAFILRKKAQAHAAAA